MTCSTSRDRVVVMKNGQVVGTARTQDVTKDEVLHHPGQSAAGRDAGPGAMRVS